MEAGSLVFQYDKIGDILYIETCPPYPEQDSVELGDDVIARLNPKTRAVESLEILFYSTRLQVSNNFVLPIHAEFYAPQEIMTG
jgi:uncharacterized protein YuzE